MVEKKQEMSQRCDFTWSIVGRKRQNKVRIAELYKNEAKQKQVFMKTPVGHDNPYVLKTP